MPQLHGEMIFNLGVVEEPPAQNGHQTWQVFRAPADTTRYFRSFSVMLGCEGGAQGDLAAQIVKWQEATEGGPPTNGIEWVISHGWDHYADPTVPTPGTYYAPAGTWWEIGPGDVLGLALLWIPFYYRATDANGMPAELVRVTPQTYYPKVIAQVIGRWTGDPS